MNHTAFAHLPRAVFAMAPELEQLDVPTETRATCTNCAVGSPADTPTRLRPLNEQVKCCTYHPTHPNWLVGRALRRGGIGAEHVRKRLLCMDDGVSVVGVGPGQALKDAWHGFKDPWAMFGREPEYLCPYFDRDTTGCNVWQDRGAICRTWFCKHEDGQRGYEMWGAVRRVLKSVERRLAAWCIVHGDPPDEADWGDADVMAAWFERCADMVDRIPEAQAAALRDDVLERRMRLLITKREAVMPPMPTYLGPSIGWFDQKEDGSGILACGHSGLDTVELGPEIFQLLSRLDGRTPWPVAVKAANDAVGDVVFSEEGLLRMFRMGLLEARDPNQPDPEPGVSIASSRLLPIEEASDAEDKLW